MNGTRLPTALSISALVVAMFGSTPLGRAAYDAVVVPNNSVGTPQLKRDAVTGGKIRNESVSGIDLQLRSITSAHVQDGGLLAADFAAGQLPAGERGATGDKGDRGETGEKGVPGATSVVVRRSDATLLSGGNSGLIATCAAGERAVGGGAGLSNGFGNNLFKIDTSNPWPITAGATPTGWSAVASNMSPFTQQWSVWVVCSRP